MTLSEYTKFTATTDVENNLYFYGLGLGEEAGEVLGKVKRIYRDDGGIANDNRKNEIILECGDMLWYATRLLAALSCTWEQVIDANVEKLTDRRARGVVKGSGDNR